MLSATIREFTSRGRPPNNGIWVRLPVLFTSRRAYHVSCPADLLFYGHQQAITLIDDRGPRLPTHLKHGSRDSCETTRNVHQKKWHVTASIEENAKLCCGKDPQWVQPQVKDGQVLFPDPNLLLHTPWNERGYNQCCGKEFNHRVPINNGMYSFGISTHSIFLGYTPQCPIQLRLEGCQTLTPNLCVAVDVCADPIFKERLRGEAWNATHPDN